MTHSSIPPALLGLALLLALATSQAQVQSQTTDSPALPEKDYFASPLDGPLPLSATFAEFRANHFHGGLDIRTGGVTGKPVRAVADGYVSRVSIAVWGGGKVLHIKHPNGFSSLYMHLDAFEGEVARRVEREQYALQTYTLGIDFEPGEYPVRQGQVVAYSGNTGGSGGPHLHFELRRDGLAFNPLHCGLPHSDAVRPTIRGVRLYPLGGSPVAVAEGKDATIGGPFYIGFYATDASEGSTLRNGFDHAEVAVDGEPFFAYNTRLFPLDSTRMVNALIDWPHFAATRQAYLLTRALPGAEGPWVQLRRGDGILRLAPGTTHSITIRIFDAAGLCTQRTFRVKITGTENGERKTESGERRTENGELITHHSSFITKSNLHPIIYTAPFCRHLGHWTVSLPARTLYADDTLLLAHGPRAAGDASATITIAPQVNNIPPHVAFTLSLDTLPPPGIEPRQVIFLHHDRSTTAFTTTHDGRTFSASVNRFGRYALAFDTVPPTIAPANIAKGRVPASRRATVRIADPLSGIGTYNCYLNGQWVLAEYDGKTHLLSLNLRGRMRQGRNTLRVEVADACGNLAVRTFTIQ